MKNHRSKQSWRGITTSSKMVRQAASIAYLSTTTWGSEILVIRACYSVDPLILHI